MLRNTAIAAGILAVALTFGLVRASVGGESGKGEAAAVATAGDACPMSDAALTAGAGCGATDAALAADGGCGAQAMLTGGGEAKPACAGCAEKASGQLCAHCTSGALGLTGADAQKAQTAIADYNKKVAAAQSELVKFAEANLSPKAVQKLQAKLSGAPKPPKPAAHVDGTM